MNRSTAEFIPYDIRPAKQTERRVLMDFLKCATEGGLSVSDCRYVGMGGNKFYDFLLMHKYLGMRNMVSLEHNKKFHRRAQFNAPFSFIKVLNESVAEFLVGDVHDGRTIYWLDYDDSLAPWMMSDITSLASRSREGHFAFVTVYAGVPGHLIKNSTAERLEYFETEFPEYFSVLSQEDMEDGKFEGAVFKILSAAFKLAFAGHPDGPFHPVFNIIYSDSVPMITVGGFLAKDKVAKQVRNRMKKDVPFLVSGSVPYKIRNFNLSDRERSLFDAATTGRSNSKAMNLLLGLGFKKSQISAYKDLIRFLPRYYEGII